MLLIPEKEHADPHLENCAVCPRRLWNIRTRPSRHNSFSQLIHSFSTSNYARTLLCLVKRVRKLMDQLV